MSLDFPIFGKLIGKKTDSIPTYAGDPMPETAKFIGMKSFCVELFDWNQDRVLI